MTGERHWSENVKREKTTFKGFFPSFQVRVSGIFLQRSDRWESALDASGPRLPKGEVLPAGASCFNVVSQGSGSQAQGVLSTWSWGHRLEHGSSKGSVLEESAMSHLRAYDTREKTRAEHG